MSGVGEALVWRRSTWCEAGACVEVATTDDRVLLRNSSDPTGPVLVLSRGQWAEFLAVLRTDEIGP